MTAAGTVEAAWTDAWGRRRVTPPAARRAVLAAMAMDRDETRRAARAVMLARRGSALPRAGDVTLEDGTELGRLRALPRDVPYGYHRWHRDGEPRLLLVVPAAMPTAPPVANLGLGDAAVRDALAHELGHRRSGRPAPARRLVRRPRRRRAAGQPAGCRQPGAGSGAEPLLPELAPLRDPLYLAVENVPGYRFLATELAPLARAGRAAERLVHDRPSGGSPAQAGGARATVRASPAEGASRGAQADGTDAGWPDLRRWGVFAALSEEHRPGLAGVAGRAARSRGHRRAARGSDALAIALPSTSGCSGCSTISSPRRAASCG